MTARMPLLIGLGIAAAWCCTPIARAAAPRAAAPVQVTLHPRVQVGDRLVLIGDVARISGGDAAQRSHIARLDVLQLDAAQTTATVSQTLVEARLLLAGAPPQSFRIDGAADTQVSCTASINAESRALAAVRAAIASELLLPDDDVVVQLAQPLSAEALQRIDATAEEDLEARLTTATITGGRQRVALWTSDGAGVRRETLIIVDVRFRQLAPVATRPMTARHKIAAGDIRFEPRNLTQSGTALTPEQVAGKALRRAVAAGEIVTDRDLIAPVATDEPQVIRPRDAVRVTVRKGTLMLVMPGAEALQAGREGELIRVRNPQSGRTVIGRVTGPGEVEVPL